MFNSLKINIKTFVVSGFSIVLILVLIAQYFSTSSVNSLMEQENQLLKSSQTIVSIEYLKSSMLNFESKIRGFVLTGNDIFLDKNEINQLQSIEVLEHLDEASLTPNELECQLSLKELINKKISFNQRILIIYNKENPTEAVNLINTGVGKQITDSIIYLSDQLINYEKSEIERRVLQNQVYIKKVNIYDGVGIFLFIVVLLGSFLIIINDINKRNKLEKELRNAHKQTEESVLIKEQFMANMSHEIRTPMNAVLGYTKRLQKTELNAEQNEYIHSLNTAGENLLIIINDILDFSKIEEGMLHIEEVVFNLQGLMHSITTMLQVKAKEKNVKLILNPLENIQENLVGDSTRLTQILVNLISNAIKFTNEGFIEISAKLIKENVDDVKIQFIVKDTGIGIPSEKLGKIFERFNQGNSDTTRIYGGTGLGLSIVKQLIELMNGYITVSSEIKKGSTFTFVLPFKLGVHSVSTNIIQESIQNQPLNLSVLIAEDNKFNQNLLILLLKDWGVKYELATNGAEVIELFKKNKYDLILMDIQMPLMNGYETTQFIRQELKNSIPIIAMTAHAFAGEKEKCISLGMTDYLSKPLRENYLYELLIKYQPKENKYKVVDLTYVREISFGKEEFVTEMILLFKEDVPNELEILGNSIKENDFETIRHISHKLKSTIPFVGIDKLIEDDLSEMESLGEQKLNIEKIQRLFNKVNDICQLAINELS